MASNLKLVVLLVFCGLFLIPAAFGQKPWEPVPRTEDWWLARHRQFVQNNANLGSAIKIVFLGSSLMEYWNNEGKPVWDQFYRPLGAYNYGIGGDRTEHVLWRIQNGTLDNISPKLLVLYIGSNNVPVFPNNDEIVRGVNTVVDKIHEKLPNTNILLVGTFPRADISPIKPTLERIRDIDQKLDVLVDGDSQRKSHFIDLFWFLAPASLDRINTELYVADRLHLNLDGYRMWQREMNGIFQSLLN